MSLESALQFLIRHNTLVIEVLFAAILFFVLVLAYRSFTAPLDEEKGTGSLANIEEALKKVLEQAKVATAAPENEKASPEAAQLAGEINRLKTELENRQKEIEALKTQPQAPQAGGALSSEDRQKLEGQIQELTSKLTEYEIISEDIADLSMYKEQNAKLQKELEVLKGGAVSESAAAATASVPVEPSPSEASSPVETIAETIAEPTAEISAEAAASALAAAVETESAEPPVSEPAPASEPVAVSAEAVSEALASEIEAMAAAPPEPEPVVAAEPAQTPTPSTVETPASTSPAVEPESVAAAEPEPQPEPQAAAVAQPVPAAEAPAPAAAEAVTPSEEVPKTVDEELMQGFAAAIEKQKTVEGASGASGSDEAAVDLGTMDMDKMMAEATTIVEDVPEISAEEALGTGLDESKLLAEASALGSQEKELMGDFEEFVKKGKT